MGCLGGTLVGIGVCVALFLITQRELGEGGANSGLVWAAVGLYGGGSALGLALGVTALTTLGFSLRGALGEPPARSLAEVQAEEPWVRATPLIALVVGVGAAAGVVLVNLDFEARPGPGVQVSPTLDDLPRLAALLEGEVPTAGEALDTRQSLASALEDLGVAAEPWLRDSAPTATEDLDVFLAAAPYLEPDLVRSRLAEFLTRPHGPGYGRLLLATACSRFPEGAVSFLERYLKEDDSYERRYEVCEVRGVPEATLLARQWLDDTQVVSTQLGWSKPGTNGEWGEHPLRLCDAAAGAFNALDGERFPWDSTLTEAERDAQLVQLRAIVEALPE